MKNNALIILDNNLNFKIYSFPSKESLKANVKLIDDDKLTIEITLLYEKYAVEVYAINNNIGIIGHNNLFFDSHKQKHFYVNLPLINYSSNLNNSVKDLIVCDLLYNNNVIYSESGYNTLRWENNFIKINLNNIEGIKEAISLWEEALKNFIKFYYTNSTTSDENISFTEGDALNFDGTYGCGNAEKFEEFNKTIIHLSPNGFQNCPPRKNIVMHELGHALGFIGHTKNRNSIMDKSDINWKKFEKLDEETIEFMRKLYSYPGGTHFCKICPCPILTLFD